MGYQFTCEGCLKTFAPEKNLYEAAYEGQTACMMCRKSLGQQDFTPDEKRALFAEEAFATRILRPTQ